MASHHRLNVDGLDPCVDKAEWNAEPRPAGVDLSGRVVLMRRALSGSRPKCIPPVRGKDCVKVQPPACNGQSPGRHAFPPCGQKKGTGSAPHEAVRGGKNRMAPADVTAKLIPHSLLS
jgi:hypothetical protein